jgi:hypothetical protein
MGGGGRRVWCVEGIVGAGRGVRGRGDVAGGGQGRAGRGGGQRGRGAGINGAGDVWGMKGRGVGGVGTAVWVAHCGRRASYQAGIKVTSQSGIKA